MKVSIVIPTYNCADLLETTLRSIKQSKHDQLEIILMDGGSTDHITEVVTSFGDLVTQFISEPDEGQYDAINKGMSRATGTILCWINGGDFFLPGAIETAVAVFESKPNIEWITGSRCIAEGNALRYLGAHEIAIPDLDIRHGMCCQEGMGFLQQEGMFWRRSLWEKAGPIDTSYRLAGDYELWIRFARKTKLARLTVALAAFSYHETNRSVVERATYLAEVQTILSRFTDREKRTRKWLLRISKFIRKFHKVTVIKVILRFILRKIPSLRIIVVSWNKKNSDKYKMIVWRRIPWIR